MTLITRWEPFREFSVLQARMNRLFQSNLAAGRDEELAANTGFAPAVDVYEDEHNITLKLEVPGIDEKDIDIRLENHTLTVRGERKLEKEEKEENFHRIERRYGSFFRSFTLPNVVDTENVKADYDKGVLKISLAKKAEAKPKQIKVSIGHKTLDSKPEPSKAEAKSDVKSAGKAA
jgi:HSP20 family protein